VEVEDWRAPSESSTGSDSDSGTAGIPGSRVSGFSHPWPKRVRLVAPADEGASQGQPQSQGGLADATGFTLGNMLVPWSPLPDTTEPPPAAGPQARRDPAMIQVEELPPKGKAGATVQADTGFQEPVFGHSLEASTVQTR
jgi:hypothetical protein